MRNVKLLTALTFSLLLAFNRLYGELPKISTYPIGESILLLIDKPYYAIGDNLHFSVLLSSDKEAKSELVYIVLVNAEGEEIVREKIDLIKDRGHGFIEIPEDILAGEYAVLAYSKIMIEASKMNYAKKHIEIVDPFAANKYAPDEPKIELFLAGSNYLVSDKINKVYFNISNIVSDESGDISYRLIEKATQDTIISGSPYLPFTGAFEFIPNDSSEYELVVNKGLKKSRVLLPKVKTNPFQFMAIERLDEVIISIDKGSELKTTDVKLLVWNNRQLLAEAKSPDAKSKTVFNIPKSFFSSGVNYISILNEVTNKVIYTETLLLEHDRKNTLQMQLSDTVFAPRSRHQLGFKLLENSEGASSEKIEVSVSIRKSGLFPEALGNWSFNEFSLVQETPNLPEYSSTAVLRDNTTREIISHTFMKIGEIDFSDIPALIDDKGLVPETKDVLYITGRLFDDEAKRPLSNQQIFINVLSDTPQIIKTDTDKDGNYNVFTKKPLVDSQIIIKIASVEGENIKLRNYDKGQVSYNYVRRSSKYIDSELNEFLRYKLENEIIERNYAIGEVKKLSKSIPQRGSFFQKYSLTINLDEYKNLNDFEEVIKELLPGVVVRNRDEGKNVFLRRIKEGDGYYYDLFSNPPLVLVNGIPLSETSRILDLIVEDISEIMVLNEQIVLGNTVYDGVMEVYTSQTVTDIFNPDTFVVKNIEGVAKQEIVKDNSTKIIADEHWPKFKDVILWEPSLLVTPNEFYQLELITSDDIGNYDVIIEGVNKKGVGYTFFKTISITPESGTK